MAASRNDSTDKSNNMQLKFENALFLLPMYRRIDILTEIFRDCNYKQLQEFYPALVESIFGVTISTWNLKGIARYDTSYAFESIFKFLHPQGTLLDIAYKLSADVYLKYHYSLSYLPQNFRLLIEQGHVPAFYLDKLNVDPVTKRPISLLLNAFELFMFHFAFHLVSPLEPIRTYTRDENVNMSETVYHHLCEQYLAHFLPIETSVVLPVIIIQQLNTRSPPPQPQPVRTCRLLKSFAVKQNQAATVVAPQPHAEIWRTETLLHIIIYFWLYAPDSNKTQLSSPISSYSSVTLDSSILRQSTLEHQGVRVTALHLRVVRNLIKHVHFFANNLRRDDSPMDDLRRTIRNAVQAPICNFLRYNINHWPLDSSFHLLLETYLSYIQPWRYQRYNSSTNAGQSTNVMSIWLPYILDNIDAYTATVNELLSKFARMDLSSPRHAHMISRLARILSEPELPALLRQSDTLVQSRGDHENHVPLFTRSTEIQVIDLLQTMTSIIGIITVGDKQETKPSGLIQWLREWLLMNGSEDYSSVERQTTIVELELAIHSLSIIFSVPPPVASDTPTAATVHPSLLDPRLAQKRAAFFKYEGNPDLEPIRSNEVASLVRSLNRISASLNQMYGPLIHDLWHREDLTGRICQQFLAAPCKFYYFHKTGPGNPAPRVAQFLPPRVCFRFLASYLFIFLCMAFILFPHFSGYTPIIFYISCVTLIVVVVFIRAALSPYISMGNSHFETDPFVPLDVSLEE